MPLHDWTDERGWDSVHPLWLTYLLEHVQERLPEGYKAFLGGVPSVRIHCSNASSTCAEYGSSATTRFIPTKTGSPVAG